MEFSRRQADPCEVNSIVSCTLENLPEGAMTQAIVEKPVPGPLNGSYSIFGTGFAYGVWTGVLSCHDISISTVAARTWKNGLGLNGQGKEGSRAMALALFPQASHLLRYDTMTSITCSTPCFVLGSLTEACHPSIHESNFSAS